MTINSKRKGKVGELELAQHFRENGFPDARRGVQYEGSGESPDVLGIPGVHIECKRTEALRLYPALEQARADAAGTDKTPAVFHRVSKKPWVVIMQSEDFLALYQELLWRRGELKGRIDVV